jgi:hypothetical protein
MPVIRRVMLAGFFGVVRGVVQVALRNRGMMSGLFMIASLMVISDGLVMLCGMFVVLRRPAMMLRGIFGHGEFSLKA